MEIFRTCNSISGYLPKLECKSHLYLGMTKDYERLDKKETDEDKATLIFSDSDLYLLSFVNNEGTCCIQGV